MLNQNIINLAYVLAAVLFIYDLKWMSHPRTAVKGNRIGALAMLIAIAATMFSGNLEPHYIIIGIAIGSVIGAIAAMKVAMTSMPEMVALFNGFGGGASVMVAGAALIAAMSSLSAGGNESGMQMKIATVATGIIGSITFFGSYVAFGKLAEFLAVKWKLHFWQKIIKYGFSLAVVAGGTWYGLSQGISALSIGIVISAVLIGSILLLKSGRFPGMNLLKSLCGLTVIV